MKRKVLCFVLTLLALAVFSWGCGGGGGHSNPAAPVISGNAKVSGVVVDSNKNPVSDAKVRLVSSSNFIINSLTGSSRLSISGNDTDFTTNTDKDGIYTFENIPLGRYSLSVDAGEQGALIPNMNISSARTAVNNLTITPFGSISGNVIDEKENNIYGAMVTLGDNCCFTDKNGAFTLTHIPVDEPYSLTVAFQGYELTDSDTSFTIPASGELKECLSNPIKLKFKETKSYKVPVKIKANGTTIKYPVTIVALDSKQKNYAVGVLSSSNDASCTLKITKAGTYTLRAITDDKVISAEKELDTITDANISSNTTLESAVEIPFGSSSSETGEIKVNIVKITNIPQEINESSVTYEKIDSSYYDGYVSDYAPGNETANIGGWTYSKITNYPNHSWIDKENGELRYDKVYLYGNSIAYFIFNQGEDSSIIWETGDEDNSIALPHRKNDEAYSLSGNSTHFAFIPDEFITVGYQYDCSSPRVYLEVYNTEQLKLDTPTPCVTLVNGEEYSEDSSSTLKANIPYDFRMARDGVNGDCYLAVLYSDAFNGLKIYNITNLSSSSAGTTVTAVVENPNIQPDNMKKFQILKDASNNTLFYVEGSNNLGEVQSYVIDSSSQIKFSDTSSTNKSCYIDSKGSMYRYVPATETTSGVNEDSRKIIKITSPFDTNQSSATSTLDLVEGSLENEEIDGIIGFEETADQLTIYAY